MSSSDGEMVELVSFQNMNMTGDNLNFDDEFVNSILYEDPTFSILDSSESELYRTLDELDSDRFQELNSDRFQELDIDPMDQDCSSSLASSPKPVSSLSFNASCVDPTTGAPLCKICFLPAGKHSYYGGQSCGSCRGFFRRAIQNGTHSAFTCDRGGNCVIDSKSRKSCTWCRFQKCLNAGMNPKWMMTDDERRVRRERHFKGKAVTAVAPYRSGGSTAVPKAPFMEWTIEESLSIQRKYERAYSMALNFICQCSVRDFDLTKSLLEMVFYGKKICIDHIRRFEQNERKLFDNFVFNFEESQCLDLADRRVLADTNFPLYFSHVITVYLHNKDLREHMADVKTMMLSKCREIEGLDRVVAQLERMELESDRRGVTYEQIYVSPWAPSEEIEQRHHSLTNRIRDWPRASPDAPIDRTLWSILVSSLVYSPLEVNNIKNKAAVEHIHQTYALMLYRYLRSTTGSKAATKFSEGLMMATMTKEAYEIHSRMLPV